MLYFIRGEFIEEALVGKPMNEAMEWIEEVIHPSLEMLDKASMEKKVLGGTAAGVREGLWVMEASSSEEIGRYLRSLPFWFALKWSVVPLQSFHSTLDQDREMFKRAREMMGEKKEGLKTSTV
jgi:hypothetical protein